MTEIVSPELIPLLTVLGNHDWVSFEQSPSKSTTYIHFHIPEDIELRPHSEMLDTLLSRIQNPLAYSMYAYSKALASGPKLLRPIREQCEALENTDVNVRFADYQQPYPAVIIELPKGFRDELSRRFEHTCNTYLVCYHDEQSGYIIVVSASADGNVYCQPLPPRSEFPTIEDAFRRDPASNWEADLDLAKVVQRLAINFCLMMTISGVTDRGPMNPTACRKQKRNAKSPNRRKADRA